MRLIHIQDAILEAHSASWNGWRPFALPESDARAEDWNRQGPLHQRLSKLLTRVSHARNLSQGANDQILGRTMIACVAVLRARSIRCGRQACTRHPKQDVAQEQHRSCKVRELDPPVLPGIGSLLKSRIHMWLERDSSAADLLAILFGDCLATSLYRHVLLSDGALLDCLEAHIDV